MNSTDTVNLNNARLLTILNAGREQLDRLRTTINLKSQLIEEIRAYPEQLESRIEAGIQVDTDDVKKRASGTVQEVVKQVMDRSEKQLQEQLRRKTELHAADTELQIQVDLLERTQHKHEQCLQKLEQILHKGEERFEKMKDDFGWSDKMLVE